ncbi:MAG: DNA polymerase III subunit gamma/tau, partial [bacterium]
MITSYIPLYRKYRPQKFKDIVGQEAIVKTLSNAIELNKVAHAYLFTGPRGTGKTSMARILAKSLNCKNGPTLEPCGKCPSCIDITNGNAIDVIEIDAASNRKVEDARNLLEKVQFVPVSGKYKIYIIDEVHMLTTEAFNTLLKTLEEPPKNLVFILATTEAHKVLNTIISRCQRFDFRRIKQDLTVERLKEIARLEDLKINDQACSLIARRSLGGLRDALSLLDQISILSLLKEEITEEDILPLLGSISENTMLELTNIIADRNISALISRLNEIIQLGNEPVQILRELMNCFRNIMLAKTTNNPDELKSLIDASEQSYVELKDQAEKFEIIEISQIIEKLSDYEKTIKTTSKQQLWLEVALISICYRHDIQIIKDLESRILKLEEAFSVKNFDMIPKIQTNPVSLKTKLPEPPSVKETSYKETLSPEPGLDTPKTDMNDISQNWKTLLDNIEAIPAKGFFSGLAKPVEINPENIIITFNNDNFVKKSREKSQIASLEKAAQKLFGTIPKITIRTPLPEDQNISENKEKEKFEQISQEIEEEIPKKSAPKVTVTEEPLEPIDNEVLNHIDNMSSNVSYTDLSDQTRTILELFQGKII